MIEVDIKSCRMSKNKNGIKILGFAKEDIGVLKNAIDYLKNHS